MTKNVRYVPLNLVQHLQSQIYNKIENTNL